MCVDWPCMIPALRWGPGNSAGFYNLRLSLSICVYVVLVTAILRQNDSVILGVEVEFHQPSILIVRNY